MTLVSPFAELCSCLVAGSRILCTDDGRPDGIDSKLAVHTLLYSMISQYPDLSIILVSHTPLTAYTAIQSTLTKRPTIWIQSMSRMKCMQMVMNQEGVPDITATAQKVRECRESLSGRVLLVLDDCHIWNDMGGNVWHLLQLMMPMSFTFMITVWPGIASSSPISSTHKRLVQTHSWIVRVISQVTAPPTLHGLVQFLPGGFVLSNTTLSTLPWCVQLAMDGSVNFRPRGTLYASS